jgi:glucose-6-phosphate 1-epimerase
MLWITLDFVDAEYKSMLCVEPAAVDERPITLKLGEECKGRLALSAVS